MFAIAKYATLFFVCVVAAVVLWRTVATDSMQVGAVRLADVLREHAERQGRLALSEAERLAAAEQFAAAFDGAVRDLSDKEHVVLLTSQAVISNIPDLTEQLKEEIDRALRRHE
jgi:hypothetical protein